MAITSSAVAPGAFQSIQDDAELLTALKELKNSIIGNTWKKVEVADEDGLLDYLLLRISVEDSDSIQSDIAGEITVIIGAIASEGSLTIRQLLEARVPEHLLNLVRHRSSFSTSNLIVAVLRALRNVLVSAADMTWGNMWGVGQERHVVGTGLVGPEGDERGREASARLGFRDAGTFMQDVGNSEGRRVLGMVFEKSNLDALLCLLSDNSSPQISLPLYQIFGRLVSQPSQRRVLASWTPIPIDGYNSSRPNHTLTPTTPLLAHLAGVVKNPKTNPKILEAALDLLAALVKDEGALAGDLCFYCMDDSDLKILRNPASAIKDISRASAAIQGSNLPTIVRIFETGQMAVQVAAAGCLTSIYRAEPKSAKFELGPNIANRLLTGLVNLMSTQISEERTKLCFILAALVTDDTTLQKVAASLDYPSLILEILDSIEQESGDGRLSGDAAVRGREAAFLALTAFASNLESTRTLIADSTLPVLTYLRDAIANHSYGVRAAACQLVRALSRTVSLVRTSLMDSGVASAVVRMFANHVPSRVEEVAANRAADKWVNGGDSWPDRDYIVEVTALAALCNLIADCIPLKQLLLNTAALRNICHLANHPSETLVVNALWALNNAMFKSSEPDKRTIVEALSVRTLIKLASLEAPTEPHLIPPR